MIDVRIIERPSFQLVGFETSFIHALSPESTTAEVLGRLWCRLLECKVPIPHRIGSEMYGLPEEQRSYPDELQYIAGVFVVQIADVPEGMVCRSVPATTYAAVTDTGPIMTLADTVYELYRRWLPQSEYEHSEIGDLEIYDDRFDPESETSQMEYLISVRKK